MTSKHSVRIKQLNNDDNFENITISSCLIAMLIQFPKSDNDKSDYSDLPGFKQTKRGKKAKVQQPAKSSQRDELLTTTNARSGNDVCEEKIISILHKRDVVSKPVAPEDDIVFFPAVSESNTVLGPDIPNNGPASNLPETETGSIQPNINGDTFLKPNSETEKYTRDCILVSETLLCTDVNKLTRDIESETQPLTNPHTGIISDPSLPVTTCTNPTLNVYNMESKSESGCLQEKAIPSPSPAISLKQKDELVNLYSNYFSEMQKSNVFFSTSSEVTSKFSPEHKENQPQDLTHHFHPHERYVPICLNMEDMSCTTKASAKETQVNVNCIDVISKSNIRKRKHSSSNEDNTFKPSEAQEKEKNISSNDHTTFRPSKIQTNTSSNEDNTFKPSEAQAKDKKISFNEESVSKTANALEKDKNISLNEENISKMAKAQEKDKNISSDVDNTSKQSKAQVKEEHISKSFIAHENEKKRTSIHDASIAQENDKNRISVSKSSIAQENDQNRASTHDVSESSIAQENDKNRTSSHDVSKSSIAQENYKNRTSSHDVSKSSIAQENDTNRTSTHDVSKSSIAQENDKNRTSSHDVSKSSIAQENYKNRTSSHDVSKSSIAQKNKKKRTSIHDASLAPENDKNRISTHDVSKSSIAQENDTNRTSTHDVSKSSIAQENDKNRTSSHDVSKSSRAQENYKNRTSSHDVSKSSIAQENKKKRTSIHDASLAPENDKNRISTHDVSKSSIAQENEKNSASTLDASKSSIAHENDQNRTSTHDVSKSSIAQEIDKNRTSTHDASKSSIAQENEKKRTSTHNSSKSSIAQEKVKNKTSSYDASKLNKAEEKKKYNASKNDVSETREKEKHRTSQGNAIPNTTQAPKDSDVNANIVSKSIQSHQKRKYITSKDDSSKSHKAQKLDKNISSKDDSSKSCKVQKLDKNISSKDDYSKSCKVHKLDKNISSKDDSSKSCKVQKLDKNISSKDDSSKSCKAQKLDKNISSNDDKSSIPSKDLKNDKIISLKDGDDFSKSSSSYKNKSKVTPNKDDGFKSTKACIKDDHIFPIDIALIKSFSKQGKSEQSSTNVDVVPNASHETIHPVSAHAAVFSEPSKSCGDGKHLPINGETFSKSSDVHRKSNHSSIQDNISKTDEIAGKSKHTITDDDKNVSEINRNSSQPSLIDDISTMNQTNSKEKLSSIIKDGVPTASKTDGKTTLVCPIRDGVPTASKTDGKTTLVCPIRDGVPTASKTDGKTTLVCPIRDGVPTASKTDGKTTLVCPIRDGVPTASKTDGKTTLVCPISDGVTKSSEKLTKTKPPSTKKDDTQSENTKYLSINNEAASKSSDPLGKSKLTSTYKVSADRDPSKKEEKTKHMSMKKSVSTTSITERKKQPTSTDNVTVSKLFEKLAISKPALVKDDIVQISEINEKRKHLPTNVNKDVSETSKTYKKSKTSITHDIGKHSSTKTYDTSKDSETNVKSKPNSMIGENLQAPETDRKMKPISKYEGVSKSSSKHEKSSHVYRKSNGISKSHWKSQDSPSIDNDAAKSSNAQKKVKSSKDDVSKLCLSQAERILTSLNIDIYKTSGTHTKSKSSLKNGEDISKCSGAQIKKQSVSLSLNEKSKSSKTHRESNNTYSNGDDIPKIYKVLKKVNHISSKEDKLSERLSLKSPISLNAENFHKPSKSKIEKMCSKNKSTPTSEGKDKSSETSKEQKKPCSINGMDRSSGAQAKAKSSLLKANDNDRSIKGHRKRKHPPSNIEDRSTECNLHKKRKMISPSVDVPSKSILELKGRNNFNDILISLTSKTKIEPVPFNNNETTQIQKGSELVSCDSINISESSLACVENTFELLETGDSSRSSSTHTQAEHIALETEDNLMSSQTNLEHSISTSIDDDISKPFQPFEKDGTVSSVSNEMAQSYLQTCIEDGSISADDNEICQSNYLTVIEDGTISADGNEICHSNYQTVIEDGIISADDNEISDSNLQTVIEYGSISAEGNEISNSNLHTVIEDGTVSTGDYEMCDSNLQIVIEDGTISAHDNNEICDSNLQPVIEDGTISADDNNEICDSNLQPVIEDGTISADDNNEICDSNLQPVIEDGTISADDNNEICDSNLQPVIEDGTFSADDNIISQAYLQAVIEDKTNSADDNELSGCNLQTVIKDGTFSADGNIISQAYLQTVIEDGTMYSDGSEITQPYLHVVIEDRTGFSDDNDISISHKEYQENCQASCDVDIIPIACHEETRLASKNVLESSTSSNENNSLCKTDMQVYKSAKAVVENELISDDCQILNSCPSSATSKITKLGSRARNPYNFVDPWRIVESDDHFSVYEICGDDIPKPYRNSQISNQEALVPSEQQKLLNGSYDQQETDAVTALLSLGSVLPLSHNSQPLELSANDRKNKYFTRKESGDTDLNVPVSKVYNPYSSSYLAKSFPLAIPGVHDSVSLAQTACFEPVDDDCIITNVSLPFSNYSSSPACNEKSKVVVEQIRPAVPLIEHNGSFASDNRMTGVAKKGQSYGTSSKNSRSPYAQHLEKTSTQFRKTEKSKSSTVSINKEPPMAHGVMGRKNCELSNHEVMVSSDEPLDLVIKKPCLNSSSGNGSWPAESNRIKDQRNQGKPNVYIISSKSQLNPGNNKPAVIFRQEDNLCKNVLMTSYDISKVDANKLATILKETKFQATKPAIQMVDSISVNQPSNLNQTFQNTPSQRPSHQSYLHSRLVSENGIQTHEKNYAQTYYSTTRHLIESDRNARTLAQKLLSANATAKPSSNYVTQKSPSTNVVPSVISSTEVNVPVEDACQRADHNPSMIKVADQVKANGVAEKALNPILHHGTGVAAEKSIESNACQQTTVPADTWQHKLQAYKLAFKRTVKQDRAPDTKDTVSYAMRRQQQTSQVKPSSAEIPVKKWKNREVVIWLFNKGLQELIPLVGNFDGNTLIELKGLQLSNPYEFYNRARFYDFPFNITEKFSMILKELQVEEE